MRAQSLPTNIIAIPFADTVACSVQYNMLCHLETIVQKFSDISDEVIFVVPNANPFNLRQAFLSDLYRLTTEIGGSDSELEALLHVRKYTTMIIELNTTQLFPNDYKSIIEEFQILHTYVVTTIPLYDNFKFS